MCGCIGHPMEGALKRRRNQRYNKKVCGSKF